MINTTKMKTAKPFGIRTSAIATMGEMIARSAFYCLRVSTSLQTIRRPGGIESVIRIVQTVGGEHAPEALALLRATVGG